jgi:hypothetical protein
MKSSKQLNKQLNKSITSDEAIDVMLKHYQGDNIPINNIFLEKFKQSFIILNKAYVNYFDFTSNSETIINTAANWIKLNTITTQGFSNNGLIHTNNRITNNSNKKIVQLEGIVSLSSGNNNEVYVGFFKNNILIPCSEQSAITSSGGKKEAIPFQCLAELDTNDYVEVWVKNETSTTNVTLKNLNVIIKEL